MQTADRLQLETCPCNPASRMLEATHREAAHKSPHLRMRGTFTIVVRFSLRGTIARQPSVETRTGLSTSQAPELRSAGLAVAERH